MSNELRTIPSWRQAGLAGAFGGGGGEGSAQHTPVEAQDSLHSRSVARIIIALSEGPIKGLVNGQKSIYLNNVPLQGDDVGGVPSYNYQNVAWAFREGLEDQTYIPNFPSEEVEVGDGRELKFGTPGPLIISVASTDVDAIRVTIGIPNLTKGEDNGDLNGTQVKLRFYIQASASGYVQVMEDTISGKTTTRYQRAYRFNLRDFGAGPWNVKVERLTADSTDASLVNRTFIDSYTRIIDAKFKHPLVALLAIRADSKTFSSIPTIGAECFLRIVEVPTNYTPRAYDPTTKTWTPASYSGDWDGTFKEAWTDNPAWCFRDMLINDVYGVGDWIKASDVDKWALYQVAQYCDQMVPSGFKDGLGADIMEPRFTCNLFLQTREQAYRVIVNMASIFRGMPYWGSGTIYSNQDRPKDPIYLFTNSNVEGGTFSYSSSARRTRHNVVLVAWNDPDDLFKQKIEYVSDDEAIADMGFVSQSEVVAMGCTSRGQAHRLGRWILYTEKYETETVTFITGLEGIVPRPGDIFEVSDQHRAGARMGGRILASDGSTHQLDSAVDVSGGGCELEVMLPSGVPSVMPVLSGTGDTVITDPFPEAPGKMAQWILKSPSLVPAQFATIGVRELAFDKYEISGLKHYPSKYGYVENNLTLDIPPDTLGGGGGTSTGANITPKNVTISEYLYIDGDGVKDMLRVTCDAVNNASKYWIEWRKSAGNWTREPDVLGPACEVPNVTPGFYSVRMFCQVQQNISPPGLATAQLLGKTARPANVTGFTGVLDDSTASLSWNAVPDLDLSHYQIRSAGAGVTDEDKWLAGTIIFEELYATKVTWQRPSTGSYNLMIKAVDTSQNVSLTPTTLTLPVNDLDDYIYSYEKGDLVAAWTRVQAEKLLLDSQASAAGLTSDTTYTTMVTKYTTLLNYLNDAGGYVWVVSAVSYPVAGWNTIPGSTIYLGPGGGANWRTKWGDYYAAADALKSSIAIQGSIATESFNEKYKWDFNGTTVPPNVSYSSVVTSNPPSPDDVTSTRHTVSAGSLIKITGFPDVAGADAFVFPLRVRLVSGTWRGRLYWSSDGTTFTSYRDIGAPAKVGQWQIMYWDLRTVTSGSGVIGSTIKGWALDLCSSAGAVVDIDWGAAGVWGAGSRSTYDDAINSSIDDLLARADVTVFSTVVIGNVTNLFPNPNSERVAVSGTPTGPTQISTNAIGAICLVNPAGANAHTGNGARFVTSTMGTKVVSPRYSCTPGDAYYLRAFMKSMNASFNGYLEAHFSDGSVTTIQTNSTTYIEKSTQFTIPATATWFEIQTRSDTSSGLYFDDVVLRKCTDGVLVVDGSVLARHIGAGEIKTYHLAVGPWLQYKATATGPVLAGRGDGSLTRGTLAERNNQSENPNDAAAYINDLVVYPNGVPVTYETWWTGTTEDRGIFMNLGSAFATSGLTGLLIKWAATTLSVLPVTGIGTYGAALKTATVTTTSTKDDKLTAIYYHSLQKAPDGTANIRLRVLVNGTSVLTATDTDLGSYGGTQGGYAGLYLAGNVRVKNPQFGSGWVTIQDGAVKADVFMSSDYAEDGSGNPTAGFKAGFGQATPIKCGPNGLQVGTAILNQASLRRNRIENGTFANSIYADYGGTTYIVPYPWSGAPTDFGLNSHTYADGTGSPYGSSMTMSEDVVGAGTQTKGGASRQTFVIPNVPPSTVYQAHLKWSMGLVVQDSNITAASFRLKTWLYAPDGTAYLIDDTTISTFDYSSGLTSPTWTNKDYNIDTYLQAKGAGLWTIVFDASSFGNGLSATNTSGTKWAAAQIGKVSLDI